MKIILYKLIYYSTNNQVIKPKLNLLGSYLEDSIEVNKVSIAWEEQSYNIQFGKCLSARNIRDAF